MKYIKLYQNHSEYEAEKASGLTLPNVSHCINEAEVHYNPITDYSKEYLTFEILESGTISWSIRTDMGPTVSRTCGKTIYYSRDDGNTWNALDDTQSNVSIDVYEGEKIILKGENDSYGIISDYDYYNRFGNVSNTNTEATYNISGNILSLFYGDNFKSYSEFPNISSGKLLMSTIFGYTNVYSAENLIFPSNLTESCFRGLFMGSNIQIPPKLPYTTLTNGCYNHMFADCTNLTIAPQLPATTLTQNCYAYMFNGCTNLVTAPELPATTLVSYCYDSMFRGCTNLVTAPELLATTLVNNCYYGMFFDCSSLNYIKAMFTTTPSNSYTFNWVGNVAANGTFVKNSAATWNVSGNNGIPTGWTVETETP